MILVRRNGNDGQEVPNDDHTMYIFKSGTGEPVFSYVIAKGSVPLSLDGVVLYNNSKSPPVEELQVLMIVDDQVQKRVCLQYVLVAHKKYKNIMYSAAGLVGSQNYLRVRTLKNEFDMLLNVGNMKFVYLRSPISDVNWFEKIRETHIMHQLYPVSDSIGKTCVDFHHEISPIDSKNSSICFLCKSDNFYMVRICSLFYSEEAKNYKFQYLKTIPDVVSDIAFSSILYNATQRLISMVGVGYSLGQSARVFMQFSTEKIDLPTAPELPPKRAITEEGEQTDSDPSRELHPPRITSVWESDDETPAVYPIHKIDLPIASEYLQDRVSNLKPGETSHEVAAEISAKIPLKAATDLVIDGKPSRLLGTSTYYTAGDERMLMRYSVTDKTCECEKLVLGNLPIMDPFIVEDGQRVQLVDRCTITSVASLKSPLLSSAAADLVFSINKGLIVKLKVRLHRTLFAQKRF